MYIVNSSQRQIRNDNIDTQDRYQNTNINTSAVSRNIPPPPSSRYIIHLVVNPHAVSDIPKLHIWIILAEI